MSIMQAVILYAFRVFLQAWLFAFTLCVAIKLLIRYHGNNSYLGRPAGGCFEGVNTAAWHIDVHQGVDCMKN